VVNEPQNPTAANNEYLPSRCHCSDNITNAPRINATITLTINTLTGNVFSNMVIQLPCILEMPLKQNLLQEK